ncbi:MAG: GNAT family N-acetyltransferase, partial [Alistipes sp.]|nr:GNAT family N-acetyltransferase [Alistipes sp.]
MEIRPLTDTDFDTLAEAFARAFADYDTQWDPTELRRMLRRRGFAPHLSFAAFEDRRSAAITRN